MTGVELDAGSAVSAAPATAGITATGAAKTRTGR